jgi:hypothetical protein
MFACLTCLARPSLLALLLLAGCAGTPREGRAPEPARDDSRALFKDVSKSAGLTFQHESGEAGRFLIVEVTAPGCALFDYDNDGRLDAFLVQSGAAPGSNAKGPRPGCALFRNAGKGRFEDATIAAGLNLDLGYAQGVAVGDYDNDGWDDLFVTAYGGNRLLRNARGRFQDVTRAQGLDRKAGTGYATSAAWGDVDNDGRLDLYVCHYFAWTPATNRECRDRNGRLDYCSPWNYPPEPHRLYRNTPRGFVDVSAKAGIHASKGRGLAVGFVDYNADGRQDIFVANDVTPNMLWRNDGGGRFTDVAVETGCAFGEGGRAMAGMGVAVADYDRSGRPSLYVTNYSRRPNILFKNAGGVFEEASDESGVGPPHLPFLSFGCEFLDYDADGWADILVNNGHVAVHEPTREKEVPRLQRKQLLRNERGRFHEISDPAELGDLSTPLLGRGLAVGDFDNDGRLDALAANQGGPAQLLRNQARNSNHWISIRAVGTRSNRNAVGARLEVKAAGARQVSWVRSGTSYLSHSDRRVYFGLGQAAKVDEMRVTWPSGAKQTFRNLRADAFYTLTEGGAPVAQDAAR